MVKRAQGPPFLALAVILMVILAACAPATATTSPLPGETGLPGDRAPAGIAKTPGAMPGTGTPQAGVTGTPAGGEATAGATGSPPAGDGEEPLAARVDGLIKLQVETSDGQSAGTVEDAFVDLRTGSVVYLVVRRQGEAAHTAGEGLVAVPYELVQQIRADAMVVVLTVDTVTLAGAPALPLEELPAIVMDPNWDSALRNYWSGLAVQAVR
jgi:sporulation protein YlmC with PRC-barrel domain